MQQFLSILLAFQYIFSVEGSGALVHQDVADRAIRAFDPDSNFPYQELLKVYKSYVLAGAAFPDWGYLCGSEAGEATHWPPFIDAYRKYLEQTYEVGTDQYNKLLAFLFGIESHIEADVVWHWGRNTTNNDTKAGYLQSMSHIASDCNDTWNSETQSPNCHNIGDLGSDFYLGGRGGKQWMIQGWNIPADDLQKIYASMGLPYESASKISSCTATLYMGALMENVLLGFLTIYYEQHTAFLTEDLDLWFHGGIEDMAGNVKWKWEQLATMIDGQRNYQKFNMEYKKSCQVFGGFVSDKFQIYEELLGIATKTDSDGNYYVDFNITALTSNQELLIQNIVEDLNDDMPDYNFKDSNITKIQPKRSLIGTIDLGYAGKSIVIGDFNGDGKSSLFYGAPGYYSNGRIQQGAVFLDSGGSDQALWLTLEQDYTRFGYALAALDLNRDGIDDLVVSAPAFGAGGPSNLNDYYPKDYNGRVYVYYGKNGTGIKQNASPSLTIRNLNETDQFFNLGIKLQTGDCNGDGNLDLIILSPYSQGNNGSLRGNVAVITDISQSQNKTLYVENSQFYMNGTADFGLFGSDAVCPGDGTLIVGSAGARLDGKQGTGSVQIYEFATMKLLSNITSDEDQSKFGQSLSYNSKSKLLAVGAPTRFNGEIYNAGAVYIYDLSSKDLQFKDYQAAIFEDSRSSRFGKSIQWMGDTLIVGAPSHSSSNSSSVPDDQGAIYTYSKANQMKGDYPQSGASSSFKPATKGCRAGEGLLWNNKYNFLVVTSPSCTNVIGGEAVRNAGNLYFFTKSQITQTEASVNQ